MTKVISFLVIIFVLAAGGTFLFLQMNKSKVTSTQETTTQEGGKRSINSILAEDRTVECQASFDGSSGTFYATGTQMRGDFQLVENSGYTTFSHIIKDGDVTYVWSEGGKQGIKFKASTSQDSGRGPQSGVDLEQEGDVDCKEWKQDASKFTIPTDVNFMDLNQMNTLPSQVDSESPQ